jgi:hypothetical protein
MYPNAHANPVPITPPTKPSQTGLSRIHAETALNTGKYTTKNEINPLAPLSVIEWPVTYPNSKDGRNPQRERPDKPHCPEPHPERREDEFKNFEHIKLTFPDPD